MFDQIIFNPTFETYTTKFNPDVFWIKNLGLGSHMLVDKDASDKTLSFDDTSPYVFHQDGNILNNKNSDNSKSLIIALNYSKKFMGKSTYIGTGNLLSVDHDLKTDPEFIIFKNVSNPADWIVWHYSFGDKGYMTLNTDEAFVKSSQIFGGKIHNKIKLYVDKDLSILNNEYVVYSFAFSKYFCSGIYSGISSENLIKTRNKPDLVVIKRIDKLGSWRLFSRLFNSSDSLRLNSFGALTEQDDLMVVELQNNGFNIRHSSNALNQTNGRYMYFCFTQDN